MIEGKIVRVSMLNYFYQLIRDIFVLQETGKGLSTNDYTTDEKTAVAKITDIETDLANKVDGEVNENGGGYPTGATLYKEGNSGYSVGFGVADDGVPYIRRDNESSYIYNLAQVGDITVKTVKVNGAALTPDTTYAVNVPVPGFSIGDDAEGNPGAYSTSLDGQMFNAVYTTDGITFSLTNGTKTTTDTLLNATAVNALIAAGLADISGVDFVVVAVNEELPETGVKGKFYLKDTGATGSNKYDEYVWVNHGTAEEPNYGYEKIGTMAVDLTGYIKESDIQFATKADIDAIFSTNSGE